MAENIDTSSRAQLNDVEVRGTSVKQTPNTSFGQVLRSGIGGTASAINSQLGGVGYIIPGASVVGAAISGVGNVRNSSTGVASGVGGAVGGGGSAVGASIGGGGGLGGAGLGVSRDVLGGSGGSSLTGSTLGGTGFSNSPALQGTSTTSSGQLLAATQQLTESNNQFNLQYLGLQENMQQENREFTAVSNVIKAKNDTAKNSLSNLK